MANVWVIGHRGAAGLQAENSCASFRAAARLGVDAIECDVHLTRDGVPVVLHDERLDRTTTGRGAVADMTLAQVREALAGDGRPVPTLAEVLVLSAGVRLIIEIKVVAAARASVWAARAAGRLDQVEFISFYPPALTEVKAVAPEVPTGLLVGSVAPDTLQTALGIGAGLLDVHFAGLTPELVRQAHATGLRLWTWTVNEPHDLQAQLAIGPDGITTDHPERLLQLCGRGVPPSSSSTSTSTSSPRTR